MNPSNADHASPASVPPEQWSTLGPDRLLAQLQAALDNPDSPLWTAPEQLRPAVPHIIPLLPQIEPPHHRYEVIRAIGQVRPDSVYAIMQAVKEALCWYRNCYVGEALARIGAPAVPALIEGLCDPDARIRMIAGWALRTMRLDPPPASTLLRPLAEIAPPDWFAERARFRPGNLSRFVTHDGPQQTIHPFREAPVFSERGGLVYFGAQPSEEHFQTRLNLLDVQTDPTDYAVFVDEAHDPLQARYLVQLRIIRPGALKHVFGIYPDDDDALLRQKHTIGALLWAFVGHQQGYWGTLFADPRAPAGALGGDGEYAREELAFGLMVETPGVYRIWSRAILVEK